MMNAPPIQPKAGARGRLLAHGVFWSIAYQVFLVTLSFASMLVLVRVIPAAEYGRAATAIGVLALINCFNCGHFIFQAIQVPEGEQPDWTAHWRAGLYIQLALTVACNAIAGAAWFVPTYEPIAPLLHVASLGLLVDWPNQLSLAMLRREMAFKHLRLVQSVAAFISAGTSVVLGFNGGGAYALIIGANVLGGLPYGLHLLFVRRWRPDQGAWFTKPNWGNYTTALRFGSQLSGTALVTALRGLLEAAVLPRAIGYESIGLLGRAQVLFSTTFGRVNALILDTVYPLLPRSAPDPRQFARHATLLSQAVLLFSIPGAVFVSMEGHLLSRLLYGAKWAAADPFIAPGTVLALGVAASLLYGSILLAANHLKLSFIASIIVICLSLPAMLVALWKGDTLIYAWALAIGQCIAAFVAMVLASRLLEHEWVRRTILPPTASSVFGAVTLVGLRQVTLACPAAIRLMIYSAGFTLVVLSVMRAGFPEQMRTVLARLPSGSHWLRLLRL